MDTNLCDEKSDFKTNGDIQHSDVAVLAGAVEDKNYEVKYNWVEITQDFISDCNQLDVGQLVHDNMFGLFEGMSAVEMMDPKMDAGMMCNKTARKVLNLQEALEAKTLKVVGFTPSELIGIIDDTLACFVTWLEGHSLAQTVFINLYMHDPAGTVIDPSLKTFCIGMLKLVDLVRDQVNRASVFEEEDFQSMTYSFKLAYDLTEAQVTAMLRDTEDELNRVMKATRLKSGAERDAETEEKHKHVEALFTRIKFVRLLVLVMGNFGKEKGLGLDALQKHLSTMKDLVQVIQKTSQFGMEPVPFGEDESCLTIMGFEPLVNQRLLPPTFPRYTKIKSRSEALLYLEAMTSRLVHICSITNLHNLHEIIEFFTEFSQKSPCLLSRSVLQMIFLPTSRRVFGSILLHDLLRDTVRTFCSPLALMPHSPIYNNSQLKDIMDTFLVQAVRPLTSIIQVTGHNRARQRDRWVHQLADLAALQEEAEKFDSYVHSLMLKVDNNWVYRACLSSWVLYHTLRVMIRYTLSGFELELYSIHEYHYVFWYLCEGLFNWLLSTLSRAESFVVDHDTLFGDQSKGRGAAGKKNKKKLKPRPHLAEITLNQALHSLCGGYYKAVIGLRMDGKLARPTFEFDCEEVRYNHRFSVFSCINTPPLMTYGQFQEMTDVTRYDPPLQATDLYNGAAKCFQQTRTCLEEMTAPSEEVQTLIKIAKTNFVVMRVLIGGHKKESKVQPEFDFSLHKLFPVIKL